MVQKILMEDTLMLELMSIQNKLAMFALIMSVYALMLVAITVIIFDASSAASAQNISAGNITSSRENITFDNSSNTRGNQ